MQASLWNRCVTKLESELSEQQLNTWIRPLQAEEDGRVLKLLAPNEFVVNWLNDHFLDRISEVVAHATGDNSQKVIVEVGSRDLDRPPPAPRVRTQTRVAMPSLGSRLNPTFTFENFVEGKSNQLARAAATQVGSNSGTAYNPLFIYGGVGLGKTHLMQAVGNMIIARDAQAKVAYVHSERFVGDMVRALQHNTINEFKRAYRGLDALLIDDIQFFAGKDRSQEEFFHTFSAALPRSARYRCSRD